ncbi:unnamed protein product [Rotaria sp. Silwood2]|nr:unnamed protein product [Rotaria sp. Silwood2]CAF3288766.1 unnamed protein product [Rotaria sp. Silwood2]CAF3321508.1 unnamed protein product [Rotaria sp. Silwood2]CAF4009626.1 unnamed protein product [Rotaria sp. Silwood2]CAF4167919.1 unnamed protein product [Rotaria sp. Silwood2]
MSYRLFQLLFLLGIFIIYSFEWDIVLNLDDSDKLLCYSCKGSECEQITNNDAHKILCNKRTQLCWAGFMDHQPYRTCANRHCTPHDFSLDSHVSIETCCHSDLCNSILLSAPTSDRSHKKTSPWTVTETSSSTRTVSTTSTYIKKHTTTTDSYKDEDEDENGSKLKLNKSDPNSFGVNWERLSYDKGFSNRIASISSILLFLTPLLLVIIL